MIYTDVTVSFVADVTVGSAVAVYEKEKLKLKIICFTCLFVGIKLT